MTTLQHFDSFSAALVHAQAQQRLMHKVIVPWLTNGNWRRGGNDTYDDLLQECRADLGGDAIPPSNQDSPQFCLSYPYVPQLVWTHQGGIFYFDDEDVAVAFCLRTA